MFSPGDVIVRREVFHGSVFSGMPVHVVEDSPQLLETFVQTGSEIGYPPHKFRHPWIDQGIFAWRGHGKLSLQRPGEAYSVDVFWTGPERKFACWYINLQEPFRRTAVGIDTMDHELDVQVLPDGSVQEKDQDHFAKAVRIGKFSAAEAQAISSTRDQILEMTRDGQPWWDEKWREWTPPSHWKAKNLPANWAQMDSPNKRFP